MSALHGQLPLDFDARTHARRSDPATSKAAAAAAGELAKSHAEAIMACLKQYGYLTAEEIGDRTGLSMVQVARRLPDLEHLQLAEPIDRVKLTRSRRPARMWRAK